MQPIPEKKLDQDDLNNWVQFFQTTIIKNKKKFRYEQEILRIADHYPEESDLYIDFIDIEAYFGGEYALKFLQYPERILRFANKAFYDLIPPDIQDEPELKSQLKFSLKCRIYNIGHTSSICDLRVNEGEFVSLKVNVSRVRQSHKILQIGKYKCEKCGYEFDWHQQYPEYNEPIVCLNENCNRSIAKESSLALDKSRSYFPDAELISIADNRDVVTGPQPYELDVLILGRNLIQKTRLGQRVILNGIYRTIQQGTKPNRKLKFIPYIEAHSIENLDERFDLIEITPEDEKWIKQLSQDPRLKHKLQSMMFPFIFGLEDLKTACVLFLFAGVEKIDDNGEHKRGDFHILLVGDPGMGKSAILKFIAKLAPRGIFTSGKAATGPGLTVTAIKEVEGWTLTGGALVQADRGICAIDEVDKVRETDLGSIYEALEQQTVSSAKAGITGEMFTRCGVIAACNPKEGRFIKGEYIPTQIAVDDVFLDRIALIYVMEDNVDELIDRNLANYILNHSMNLTLKKLGRKDKATAKALEELRLPMTTQELRKYIAYAKKINPYLPPNINDIITEHFVTERQKGNRENLEDGEQRRIALSARQIEDLIRLTEASARMRLSKKATMEDVKLAINVFSNCMDKIARDKQGYHDIDLFTYGRGSEDRSTLTSILNIIRDLQKRFENGAPIEALKLSAKDHSPTIDENTLQKALDILQDTGAIFYTDYAKSKILTRGK